MYSSKLPVACKASGPYVIIVFLHLKYLVYLAAQIWLLLLFHAQQYHIPVYTLASQPLVILGNSSIWIDIEYSILFCCVPSYYEPHLLLRLHLLVDLIQTGAGDAML